MASLIAVSSARADLNVGQLTTWPILIAADATPAERHAADEFREFLAQATGSRMEIIETSRPRDSAVFIGKAASRKAENLGEEAFRIVIGDHRVEITGGSRAARSMGSIHSWKMSWVFASSRTTISMFPTPTRLRL